ncbi:hypothetical protein [Aureibacter tunicatorum]|uniref:Lipoprotein n=1 Tax=Aureibacter tunicatorum TaxID=866807 RepID=A0AAE3XN82_9BACT|nr:hypothetical protein [Aureibacter tunicatorum]MDR6240062.1 hypothetical protein [Aureibacter tunicatorum]BDD04534.1 hypothetical protein AUTU_20170 [Aureibacter tunicatorum]
MINYLKIYGVFLILVLFYSCGPSKEEKDLREIQLVTHLAETRMKISGEIAGFKKIQYDIGIKKPDSTAYSLFIQKIMSSIDSNESKIEKIPEYYKSAEYLDSYLQIKAQLDSAFEADGIEHIYFFNPEELEKKFYEKDDRRDAFFRQYNLLLALESYVDFQIKSLSNKIPAPKHDGNIYFHLEQDTAKVDKPFEFIIQYEDGQATEEYAKISFDSLKIKQNGEVLKHSVKTYGPAILVKFSPKYTGKCIVSGRANIDFPDMTAFEFYEDFSTHIDISSN